MDPTTLQTTSTTTATTSGNDNEGGRIDPPNILKGKRTKRPRPTILTHSTTSYNPSPTSSSDFPATSTTTEDEDTANCLILLSKGHNIHPIHDIHNNNIINIPESSCYKFNSKKYINGLTGSTYVYECKTCTRTFSSFQALGGHRASHKKPRITEPETQKQALFSDEDEPSSVSHNMHQRIQSPNSKKFSSKLHECSICGAEFNSGQALGGHMRRHRGNIITSTNANTNTNTTLSLIPYSPVTTTLSVVADDRNYDQKSTNDGLCLDLDLNLPASTLVDCHY
ncbi:zinc finger protein ZAT5-like [Bidens hawaiensis]|uniref:zinc finger protein ZAT5-like n=1 Tax=Bidens hawaiensis TaxID=980011 RepID=UPI00404AD82F